MVVILFFESSHQIIKSIYKSYYILMIIRYNIPKAYDHGRLVSEMKSGINHNSYEYNCTDTRSGQLVKSYYFTEIFAQAYEDNLWQQSPYCHFVLYIAVIVATPHNMSQISYLTVPSHQGCFVLIS